MKTLRFLFVFLLLLAPAAQAQEKIFNAETFTLENGLQVVVIPNHRAPVVTQMVWYKTGAIDEPPGESGIAHFVEHLMFKGTDTVPPGAFSKRVKAMGGNDNAFTNQDYTAYFQSIARERLPDIMEMEADRMTHLAFPPDHVLSERDVVIEERRQRTENDPRGYFYEQLRAALFVNHPYGNPVIGWFHEVDALDRDHVKSFYDRWYAPNNAILVVTGDITMNELRPLAEKYYGVIPRRDVPKRHWTEVPPLLALPKLILRDPTIRQPVLQRLYRAPSYAQNRDDSLALQVLEEVLDGGAATYLYKTLVVEQKIATSVNLSYNSGALSDGLITMAFTPAENVSLEQLEENVNKALRDFIAAGVTDAELREAKDRMKDAAIFARDSLQGPAMIFGQTLVTGGTVDDVEYWPSYIEKVTADQVMDVAKRFLDPDRYGDSPYVTGYMMPPEETNQNGN